MRQIDDYQTDDTATQQVAAPAPDASSAPAAPAAPASPASPAPAQSSPQPAAEPEQKHPTSLLGKIAQAVVNHVEGGTPGHRPLRAWQVQDALNRQAIAEGNAKINWESAQAAHTWAQTAAVQAQLDAMPQQFQEKVREADQKSVDALIAKGRSPRMVLPDDKPETLQAMQSELARANGGQLPGITLMHYGNGYAVYTSDQLSDKGLLESVNPIYKVTADGEMTPAQWAALTPQLRAKKVADAFQVFSHPSAIRGENPQQTIARYKSYLAKAQALPDDDTDKARLVSQAKEAVGMLQSGLDANFDQKTALMDEKLKRQKALKQTAGSGVGKDGLPKLTASTKTMVEAAPHVIELAERVEQLVKEQQATLGPAASRWQEYMAGTVGAPNPEFTKLRTDVGLLTTLLMRMHVGARGGEYIMKEFKDLMDSGRQSPENLLSALEEVRKYASDVQNTGKPPSSLPSAETGGTVRMRAPNGQIKDVPANKVEHFKAKGAVVVK